MSLKDHSEEHQIIQSCVDYVIEYRGNRGFSAGSTAKISFYTFFLWLLPKVGVISESSAVTLRSVYMVFMKNTTGIDVFPIMSHLFKWFSSAEEDAVVQEKNEVLLALYSVSAFICERDHDKAFLDYQVSLDALQDVLSIFSAE